MKRILPLFLALILTQAIYAATDEEREQTRTRNRYELAERFTAGKLQNMLFSTSVDPHWFKSGEKFTQSVPFRSTFDTG